MSQFESVIGIEIHVQLNTNSKLFCRCANQAGDAPNSNTCPTCLGLPGALPVLNNEAVKLAIKAGLALDCDIRETSVFSRKNYFYPDLPKGYQISQFDLPICENGSISVDVEGTEKTIRINRIHIEEDAGKLVHQGAEGIAGATGSAVDLNRASTPLIEIVTEPDIRSAKEAKAFLEAIKAIVTFCGISEGNMEEGHLRADANVSIRPVGQAEYGTKAEVKNMNSFRSVERAIEAEIARQITVVKSGGVVVQETRNYDDATQKTSSMRSKEEAHDYRYFPEPDLLPLIIDQSEIDQIKAALPELPAAKKERYQSELSIPEFEAGVLTSDRDMDHYFTTVCEQNIAAPLAAKWIVGDLNAIIKDAKATFKAPLLPASTLAEILVEVASGKLSNSMGKTVLHDVIKTGKSPKDVINAQGGGQISDSSELQGIVDQILADNPDVVEKIKAGKKESANFLMGQVMKASKGRAKPDLVKQLIFASVDK